MNSAVVHGCLLPGFRAASHAMVRDTAFESWAAAAATIWITGLSGAGKSTLAAELKRQMLQAGAHAMVLDGDVVRGGLNRDLGFTAEDRSENIRRVAEVARLANEQGYWVLAALISPLAGQRLLAQQIIGPDRFIEVYVSTPLEVCASRDSKGLYARARAGALPEFTGVSAAYEAPLAPAANIDASQRTPQQAASEVIGLLRHRHQAG